MPKRALTLAVLSLIILQAFVWCTTSCRIAQVNLGFYLYQRRCSWSCFHLKCNVMKAVAQFMVPINSQESSVETTKNLLYFGNRMGHCVWGLKLSITFSSSSVQPTLKNLGIQQQLFEVTITKRAKGWNFFLLTF